MRYFILSIALVIAGCANPDGGVDPAVCSLHRALRTQRSPEDRAKLRAQIAHEVEVAFGVGARFKVLSGDGLEALPCLDCPECDRLVDRWLLTRVWEHQRGLPRD